MSRQQWGHAFWRGVAAAQDHSQPAARVDTLLAPHPEHPSATCAGCQEIRRAWAHEEDEWQLAEDLGFLVDLSGSRLQGNDWYLHCLRRQQPWVLLGYEEHHGDKGFFVEVDFRPSRRVLTSEGCDLLLRWLRHDHDHATHAATWGLNNIVGHLRGVPLADARTFAQLVLLTWHRHHQPAQELPGYLEHGAHARVIDTAAAVLHPTAASFEGKVHP